MEYKLINHWTDTSTPFPTLAEAMWHINGGSNHALSPYHKDAQFQSLELWRGDIEHYGVVSRRGQLCVVLEGAGTAQHLLLRMLDELKPYARRSDGRVKKPFEMMAAQWGAINLVGRIAYGAYPAFSPAQLREPVVLPDGSHISLVDLVHREFMAAFGYGHNGPCYGNGRDINNRHELHVGYALLRGDNVPEAVIRELAASVQAEEGTSRVDAWIQVLLDKPFLRGAFKCPDVLWAAVSKLRSGATELTHSNFRGFADLMATLPEGASTVDVDDALHHSGYLKPYDLPAQRQSEPTEPINGFAVVLQASLAEHLAAQREASLEARRSNMSVRSYILEKELNAREAAERNFAYANKIAAAVESRDIEFLLDVLDNPRNVATSAAVEEHFGIKLKNVRAAERRKAIFRLAGYETAEAIAMAEAEIEQRAKQRRHIQAFTRERERAAAHKFVFAGTNTDGAAIVDQLIEQGFNSIESKKSGAATLYYLCHPVSRKAFLLGRNMGTLDYARLALEQQALAVATECES